MKLSNIIFLIFIYSMIISHKISAQEKNVTISWSQVASLPDLPGRKQLGVAGPFAGVSDGVLLIGGGANFPEAKPWKGGKKANRNDIYALKKLPGGKFECKLLKDHLPNSIAYGSSVTTEKGIICIGGETDTASCSNTVFMMKFDAETNKVKFFALPSFPSPIVNSCAALIHHTVFVFGGESNGLPVSSSFKLDLDNCQAGWKSIPSLPIAMSHSVAVTQSNGRYPCIYVVGGRSASASGISQLHKNTFCYDPIQQEWQRLADISDGKAATNMSAATAVAENGNNIVLIGGDKGDIFHKIECYNAAISKSANEKEKQTLLAEKLQLITQHPGFSRDVYLYNTLTDKWQKLGGLPFYGQVTTTAMIWDNDIFIPGGEIMPGTRTAAIIRGVINK